MSLWTPDGEHVPQPDVAGPAAAGQQPPEFDDLSVDEQVRAQEMAKEMAEAQTRILEMPAADIVANHAMGFYELAALHLSQDPPSFDQAAVAVDAMAAVLDKLKGRLGEAEATLSDARAQLQMVFVQLKAQAAAPTDSSEEETEAVETAAAQEETETETAEEAE